MWNSDGNITVILEDTKASVQVRTPALPAMDTSCKVPVQCLLVRAQWWHKELIVFFRSLMTSDESSLLLFLGGMWQLERDSESAPEQKSLHSSGQGSGTNDPWILHYSSQTSIFSQTSKNATMILTGSGWYTHQVSKNTGILVSKIP